MTVISLDRFGAGATWSEYLSACTKEVERRRNGYEAVRFTPEQQGLLERLRPLGLKVLVLEEDWCGDAARSGPVLARLAEVAGMEARWLRRDENLDIMDRYLENGSRAIPVVIFMDRDGQFLARWGSRPKHVAAVRDRYLPTLPPKDGPGFAEARGRMWQAMSEAYEQGYPDAIVAELLECITTALGW